VKSADQIIGEVQRIWNCADAEGRELFATERDQVESLLNQARQVKMLEGEGGAWDRGGAGGLFGGPGDQFVHSKAYTNLIAKGRGNGPWTSEPVEISTKGTLFTTPGTALTPAGYVPGITQALFERPTIASLCAQAQAPGNPVRFVSETTATNAAAATDEGEEKPESSIVFGETSEPVRKVATFLPISDELLEDAPQLSAYLNQRLQLFINTTEDQELLLGSGTAPHLAGFISPGNRAIGTYARGTVDSNEVALFKAATGTRGSSFLDPDTIVINPANWQTIRLGKDSSGQYYGGGPFQIGPYGGPQGPASAQGFEGGESLWGMRVVVTSAITVGSALLGAFGQGACVYRKGGLRVDVSNSHSTWFQSDISALRAEERLALALFRPTAFTVVKDLA
jgi:HK97 family phage major capsid protein